MNNDIPRLNIGAKTANNNLNNNINKNQSTSQNENSLGKEFVEDSMNVLGAMGCAQVKMNKSDVKKCVAKSTKDFINNPDFVEAHVEFCDNLVKRGYSLEEAIKKTDLVFEALKDEKTYS